MLDEWRPDSTSQQGQGIQEKRRRGGIRAIPESTFVQYRTPGPTVLEIGLGKALLQLHGREVSRRHKRRCIASLTGACQLPSILLEDGVNAIIPKVAHCSTGGVCWRIFEWGWGRDGGHFHRYRRQCSVRLGGSYFERWCDRGPLSRSVKAKRVSVTSRGDWRGRRCKFLWHLLDA